MKIRKLIPAIAAVVAVSLLSLSVCAFDIDKDMSTGWSKSATVPSEEFAELTETSVITITYTADASLADMEGHSYWVIKPMVNDAGWPLVTGITQLPPSEDGSSYVVDTEATEISFTIPADFIEQVKVAGLAFMGHGITIGTLTVSNDAPIPEDYVAPTESTTETAPATDKANSDTGVEGIAVVAGLAVLAASAVVIARKRK